MDVSQLIELTKKCIQYGKYEYASGILNKLDESYQDDAEMLVHIGELYVAIGQYASAQKALQKSFDIKKDFYLLELLAKVNFQCENYEDAAIQFETLVEYNQSDELFYQCIESYKKLGLYEEVIRIAKLFIEKTGSINSYLSLFDAYVNFGMEKEAIECAETIKKQFPNSSGMYNALGLLNECIYNDYERAKDYYKKSAKLGYIDAYYNLGVCCKQSEDLENSEKYLKKLISLKAQTSFDYNHTLGTVYLAARKLRLGYKYYKNRSNVLMMNDKNRTHLWDGKEYPDQTLYIKSEQSYGDTVQMVRYLPYVVKKFKKVYFAVRESLLELFKRSFPVEEYPNVEFVNMQEIVRYNKFVFLMDIPYLLHETFHNIPSKQSYLVSSERKRDMFKTNFFNNEDFKLGLCWKAQGMNLRDAVYRTIDAPYYFKPIMDFENVKYYSFQINDIFDMCEKYPQVKDLSEMLDTFDETAAALKNLDVLITVDTALAHIAGALGVKTYLLLCHAPDWRWFDNTEKTEWYPSVTIIRQKDRRSWEDVSEKLTELINQDLAKFKEKEK